jgi:hypothetical protein
MTQSAVHGKIALSKSTCLFRRNTPELPSSLECASVLDEDPILRANAGADNDGCGSAKAKSVPALDDDDRHTDQRHMASVLVLRW